MHKNTDNERTVWEMDLVRDGGEGNAVSHRHGTDLFACICLLSFNMGRLLLHNTRSYQA